MEQSGDRNKVACYSVIDGPKLGVSLLSTQDLSGEASYSSVNVIHAIHRRIWQLTDGSLRKRIKMARFES